MSQDQELIYVTQVPDRLPVWTVRISGMAYTTVGNLRKPAVIAFYFMEREGALRSKVVEELESYIQSIANVGEPDYVDTVGRVISFTARAD